MVEHGDEIRDMVGEERVGSIQIDLRASAHRCAPLVHPFAQYPALRRLGGRSHR